MIHHDLTHPIEPGMPVYPGDPPVEVEPHAAMAANGYRVSGVSFGTHTGTHVDAPSHTEPDGDTIDAFGIDAFAFVARRVDLRWKAPREPIVPDDLPDSAGADLLVLDTGWAARWGTDAYLDHPYLDSAAAAWCAHRGLSVGIDAPSVDPSPGPGAVPGEPEGVPAHHELLGADLPIIENLTNLAALPDRFSFMAFPLALAGADGAPVRAVATVD